jgi:hypothetical protein
MGSEVTVPANFFFSPGIHDIPVHTAGLAPGLYSLLIQGQNEQGIYKMIIR